MASALSNLSEYNEENIPSAEKMSFGIVVAEWNRHITHALLDGCVQTLLRHGATEDNIRVAQVPGSFELTAGAAALGAELRLDAVICLGCVIKGETSHDEYINHAVAGGLTQLGIQTGKPHIFGLLTVLNEHQALDRAGGRHGNKGVEAAVTAIRMVALKQALRNDLRKIGF
ncbi:MAG: 6,7-dimethyl-8-ribityllumazine synthase [Bacteroidota bacterium]|jgi:6,7-dimethyl-8-ribityllumazine synthase